MNIPMTDIDKISWRYMRQSLVLLVSMTLLALLAVRIWLLDVILTPLLVSVIFALIIEIADVSIWRRVAKKAPDSLPTFFMAVSGFRMLAGIGVMLVYYLSTDHQDMLIFFGIFMAFYFAIMIHHTLFFTVKNKSSNGCSSLR